MATPPSLHRHSEAEESGVSHPECAQRRKRQERGNKGFDFSDRGDSKPHGNIILRWRIALRLCVTCPKCGVWVVVKQQHRIGENKEEFRTICPLPECGKKFSFELGEALVFVCSNCRYFFLGGDTSSVLNCSDGLQSLLSGQRAPEAGIPCNRSLLTLRG